MKDEQKTREQLIDELKELRQLIAKLKDLQNECKRVEVALNTRLRYEMMLTDISARAALAEDINEFQNKCLEIMGKTLDVSSIYIFEHRRQTHTMDNTFEWAAPGVTLQKELLQGIASSAVPWWTDMMKNNKVINYEDVEEIPEEQEKEILRPQSIKSILVVPLFVERKYYGFMGLDECRYHREWPAEEVNILRTIARIMTGTLERKQLEQTLREKEAEVGVKTNSIEEVNTALRVLLKRKDEDKIELEERVLLNVKELVEPYLRKLKNGQLDARQEAYVDILESNLNDIISPFLHKLSSKYLNLTPTEIQVANLVKEGKTTKDIAELMNLSTRTVEFHRENIRKKMGIKNKKANLRSCLLSLQ